MLGALLVCSCLLVVAAIVFYLCSAARLGRTASAPAASLDDVADREATPTTVRPRPPR